MSDFLLRNITIYFFLFSQLKKRKQIYYHSDIVRKNVVHEHKAKNIKHKNYLNYK